MTSERLPERGTSVVLAVLAPLVAVAVAAAGLLAPDHADDRRAPREVTVRQTTVACAPGADVAAGALEAHAGAQVAATRDGEPVDGLGAVDRWTSSDGGDAPTLIRTEDAEGAGAMAFGATRTGSRLAVAPCPGPRRDAWFVGGGSAQRHFSTLHLTNLSPAQAVVDVSFWGAQGPVEGVGSDGIVLEEGDSTSLDLDDLAAGEPELALHVSVRRGAVASDVLDRSSSSVAGTETLPASAAPSRDQVVGGIARGGARTLLLLNPGDETATAQVQGLAENGPVTPEDLDRVEVPAGRLVSVDVPSSALGSAALGLRVRSTHGVVAAVRSVGDDDVAVAGPVEPLEAAAVVPIAVGRTLASPALVASAPGREAKVTVISHDAQRRELGRRALEVPAGSTRQLSLTGGELREGAYVVVEPTGDVVVGATYGSSGGQWSALPVTAAPVSGLAPDVRPAP